MPDYEAVARWEWRETGQRGKTVKMHLTPSHAVEPEAVETLCGAPTTGMESIGPWPTGMGGKCYECQRLVGT